MALPSWLVPFFGMPSVRAGDVSLELASRFGENTRVFPCFNRLPMGWSHSVFLAQEAHLHLMFKSKVLSPDDRISKFSDMRLDRPRWFIYIDDFCIVGLDPVDIRALQDVYLEVIRSCGFVAKPSKLVLPTSEPVSLLGLEFDGARRVFGLASEKLSVLCKDTRRFVSATHATGKQLSSLLGRWSWAMLVRRPFFAVLSAVFNFVQAAGSQNFSIWPSVRRELLSLVALAPLLSVFISSSVFPVPVAVDASSSGAGVVALQASARLVAPVASFVSARADAAPLPCVRPAEFSLPSSSLPPVLLEEVGFQASVSREESSSVSSLFDSASVRGILSCPSSVVSSFPWASPS
jgi:hypothetical protein